MNTIRCNSTNMKLMLGLMITAAIIGCTKQKLPHMAIRDIRDYESYQTQHEVRVAIDIFSDEKRLLEYFGVNLLSYAILPIHLIIENNSTHPLLIERTNIVMNSLDESSITPEPLSYAKMPIEKGQRDAALAVGLSGMLFPLPTLLFLPALLMQEAITQTAKENMSTKALYDKGIYSGESYHGFLYFPLKDILNKKGKIILQARFKILMTEDTYSFKFDINTNEIIKRIEELKLQERSDVK